MVDREFFEREVLGKAEGELEFWNKEEGVGRGFHAALKSFRKTRGEDSLVVPKVGIVWSGDMVVRGEEVELPECLVLDDPYAMLERMRRN